MKKLYSMIIIFGILIVISNTVFATDYWKVENEKRETAIRKAVDSYMQTFISEEVQEEDRIKDYICTGFSMDVEGEKFKSIISFHVTPTNENNTTWSTHGNICFARFAKVNDEYVLEKISRYPDNYDKFLERFEEYKKNKPITIENTQIQGEELTNNLANQEIKKTSNIIYTSCLIILIAMIFFIITRIVKKYMTK